MISSCGNMQFTEASTMGGDAMVLSLVPMRIHKRTAMTNSGRSTSHDTLMIVIQTKCYTSHKALMIVIQRKCYTLHKAHYTRH